jgi:hypothetical protein
VSSQFVCPWLTRFRGLFSRMTVEHPTHPQVVDVAHKAAAFDELATKFEVPASA